MLGASHLRRMSAGLAACLLSASCITFDPYVGYTGSGFSSVEAMLADTASPPVRVAKSVDFALGSARAMATHANDSSLRQSLLFGVAIPAAAVAAYYGITGEGSTDAISGLGVTATTAFGVATLTNATPKQRIYIAGTRALSCVAWAAAPLIMTTADYDRMVSHLLSTLTKENTLELGQITTAISTVELKRSEWAETGAELGDLDAALQKTRSLLDRGNAAVLASRNARASGGALQAAMQAAPLRIVAQTKAIEAAVNLQLSQQQPSVEAVTSMVGQFRTASDSLIATLAPPKTPAATSQPDPAPQTATGIDPAKLVDTTTDERIANANKEMAAAIEQMASARRKVGGLIDALEGDTAALNTIVVPRAEAARSGEHIEACMVNENAAPAFSVTPADANVEIAQGETQMFTLAGGSGIYSASLSGAETGKVTIEWPGSSPFANRLPTIKIDALAKAPATFRVVFTDLGASPQSKVVTFSIKAPAKTGTRDDDLVDGPGGDSDTGPDEASAASGPQIAVGRSDSSPAGKAMEVRRRAIAQLAFYAGSGQTPKAPDIDGDWGLKTDLMARAYLTREIGAPRTTREGMQSQLRDLLRSDSAETRFFNRATEVAMRNPDALKSVFAANGKLAGCKPDQLRACWYQ